MSKTTYFVYVLKSQRDNIRYVGSGESPQERLRRHNNGDYRITKGHRPWRLVYQERFTTQSEAYCRELFLKSGAGRKLLDEVLKKGGNSVAGSSNGRTAAFEAVNPGSSPGPAK